MRCVFLFAVVSFGPHPASQKIQTFKWKPMSGLGASVLGQARHRPLFTSSLPTPVNKGSSSVLQEPVIRPPLDNKEKGPVAENKMGSISNGPALEIKTGSQAGETKTAAHDIGKLNGETSRPNTESRAPPTLPDESEDDEKGFEKEEANDRRKEQGRVESTFLKSPRPVARSETLSHKDVESSLSKRMEARVLRERSGSIREVSIREGRSREDADRSDENGRKEMRLKEPLRFEQREKERESERGKERLKAREKEKEKEKEKERAHEKTVKERQKRQQQQREREKKKEKENEVEDEEDEDSEDDDLQNGLDELDEEVRETPTQKLHQLYDERLLELEMQGYTLPLKLRKGKGTLTEKRRAITKGTAELKIRSWVNTTQNAIGAGANLVTLLSTHLKGEVTEYKPQIDEKKLRRLYPRLGPSSATLSDPLWEFTLDLITPFIKDQAEHTIQQVVNVHSKQWLAAGGKQQMMARNGQRSGMPPTPPNANNAAFTPVYNQGTPAYSPQQFNSQYGASPHGFGPSPYASGPSPYPNTGGGYMQNAQQQGGVFSQPLPSFSLYPPFTTFSNANPAAGFQQAPSPQPWQPSHGQEVQPFRHAAPMNPSQFGSAPAHHPFTANGGQSEQGQFTPSEGQFTPSSQGQFTPTDRQFTPTDRQFTPTRNQYTPTQGQFTPSSQGQFTPTQGQDSSEQAMQNAFQAQPRSFSHPNSETQLGSGRGLGSGSGFLSRARMQTPRTNPMARPTLPPPPANYRVTQSRSPVTFVEQND